MLADGFRYLHGAINTNLVLPVTANPDSIFEPTVGELVYNTASDKPGVFIYNGKNWIRAINTNASPSGDVYISSGSLPSFDGDVTSSGGSSTLLLKEVFPTADETINYNAVSVNKKGQVIDAFVFNSLAEFGITPNDPLLNTKEEIAHKNLANGYAGLDANGLLAPSTLPPFSGDITSTGGSHVTLTNLFKPFTPVNIGDIDPHTSVAGTYNKVIVNEKGLVVDGIALDLYVKSEIDALIGGEVYHISATNVTLNGVTSPIDETNSINAIIADATTSNSKKGDIAIIDKLGLSYIKEKDHKTYSNIWTLIPSSVISAITANVNGTTEVLSFDNAHYAIDSFFNGQAQSANTCVYLVGLNTCYQYTNNVWTQINSLVLNDTTYITNPLTVNNADTFLDNSASAVLDNGYVYLTSLSLLYQKHIVVNDSSTWTMLPQQYGSVNKAKVISNLSSPIALTNSSEGLQIIQLTNGNQYFTLPKASTVAKGGPLFILRNNSTSPFGIKSFDGTLLTTATPDSSISIYSIGNNETDWVYIAQTNKMAELVGNKSTDITLTNNGTASDVLYPSQKAAKTYIDNAIKTNVTDLKGHSVVTNNALVTSGIATLDEHNTLTVSQLPASSIIGAYKIPDTFMVNNVSTEVTVNNYQLAIQAYKSSYNVGEIIIINHIGYVCVVTGTNEYTIIEKNVIYINDEYALPLQTDAKFNADVKYKVTGTTRSYTWNGLKYVQIDALFASHTYIVDDLNATKTNILTASTQHAQKNDIAYILAEKKSYILTDDYLSTDTNQQKIDKWIELTTSGNYINSAQYVTLSANLALDKNSARLLLVNSTGNWTITLPDASTLPKGGMLFVIKNTSQFSFVVNAVGGALVQRMDQNRIFNFYLTSNQNDGWLVTESTLTADSGVEYASNKNIAGGYAGLDSNGKLLASQMPPLAITDIDVISVPLTDVLYQWPANTQDANKIILNLTDSILQNTIYTYYTASGKFPQKGDIVVLNAAHSTYILSQDVVTSGSDWVKLNSPTDSVQLITSVAGKTGAVTLTTSDVGLSNVTNDKQLKDTQTLTLAGDILSSPTLLNAGLINVSVKKLNGKPISNTAPTNGQSLTYNSSTGELGWTTITSGTMNASGLTGTLSASVLPAFTGDVTSTQGFNVLTLAQSGVVAGTYKSVAVDSKGRVVSGSNPTTISGFGITDVYSKTEVDAKDSLKLDISNSDVINGYAKVQSDGKVLGSLIPVVPISNTTVANTPADVTTQIAAAQPGDVIVNNVTGQSLIKLADGTAVPLNTPTDTVTSINGRKGVISKIALADTTGIVDINNKLTISLFPTLTGDITNVGLTTSLSNTGISAGEYSTVTVDAKGRVISGKTGVSYTKLEADALYSIKLDITSADSINGYAKVQSDGKISGALVPVIPITNTTVANTPAELAVQIANAQPGDVIINNITGQSVIVLADGTTTPLNTPTNTVTAINGRNGNISKILLADTSGIADSSGKLDVSLVPHFTGDITNTGLSVSLTNTGIAAGEYSTVTVDAKGRVTSGKTGVSYTKSEADSLNSLKLDLGKSDIINGYAKVQSDGKVLGSLIPVVPITNTTVATTTADYNAQVAAAQPGDVIINNVTGQSMIKLADGTAVPLNTPTDTVTSINGRKGIISKIALADTTGIVDTNNKLDISLFPNLTGDITNIGLSTSLSNTGVTPGEYSVVTVDSKGRVITGRTGVSYTKTEADALYSIKLDLSKSDIIDGYAKVHSDGKISGSLIPAIPIANTTVATTTAEYNTQVAAAQPGDVIINNVTGQSMIKLADGSVTPLNTPTNTVTSINGRTGTISKINLADTSGIVDANNKLDISLFPTLTGDVTNTGLSTSLSNTGVLAGQYNTVTVDSKGRVTAASNQTYGSSNASDLTSGTLKVSLLPAFTGDIATTAGSNNVTVNKITNYGITGTAANKNTLVFDSASNSLIWSMVDYNNLTNKPTNVSAFANDLGYQTVAQVDLSISNKKGVANGLCELDANAKVPLNRLPESIIGQLEYKGVLDFTLNTLPIASAANLGWYYIASNTLPSNGYAKGDWAVSNGVSWDKIDNSAANAVSLPTTKIATWDASVQLEKASSQVQSIAMNSDNLSVILPPANLFDLGGFHYVIANNGHYPFTIVNNANESICMVDPNASVALLLLDNADAKGKWQSLIGSPSYTPGLKILDSQTLVSSVSTSIQNAALSLNSSISMYISLNKLYATVMDHQSTITLSASTYLVDATEITSFIMLTGTLGVIVYKDPNANYKAARVVIGATISLTSTMDVSGFSNYALSQIDDSHALLVSSNPTLNTSILDVSVSLTKSNNIDSNIPSIHDISLCNIADHKYFISYQKSNEQYAIRVLNILNGTVSFSAETMVSNSNIVVSNMVKTSIHSAILTYHTTAGYSEVIFVDSSTYNGIEEAFAGLPTRLDLGRLPDIAIVALAENQAICAYSYQGALNLIELTIKCGNIGIAQRNQRHEAGGLVSLCRVNNTYSCTFTNRDGYPSII